jgi:hypothetical protein
MSRLLVLFVYHLYNKRVQHFIDKCIFEDPEIDFVVISNNGMPTPNLPPYVKQVVRPNIGYDFGGWSDALLTDNLYEAYSHFIFVNSSVMGPFIRPDSGIVKWTDVYLRGLAGNVKLFGSTINSYHNPFTEAHVQSYIFSVDKETLQYLIDVEIFSNKKYTRTLHETVVKKEIGMSRKVLERGWNIGSLMSQYQGVDFTFRTTPISAYRGNIWVDEIMQSQYRNIMWNEYQLVFVKGNRLGIDSIEELKEQDKNPAKLVNRAMNIISVKNEVMKVPMFHGMNVRAKNPIKMRIASR